MEISTVVIGIILFAIATMIIYGWGLVKQKNQSSDLMNMLFSKGNSKVKKYLKKNEYITLPQVAELCDGIEAKLPFSKNKAIVKDKNDFAKQLMQYMVKTGQVEDENGSYKKSK